MAIKVATASPVSFPDRPSLIPRSWRRQRQRCVARCDAALAVGGINVFAPDLPGHGISGGKPLASIEKIADWLLSLVAALGLDQTALAGHSMGSLAAALEAAARGAGGSAAWHCSGRQSRCRCPTSCATRAPAAGRRLPHGRHLVAYTGLLSAAAVVTAYGASADTGRHAPQQRHPPPAINRQLQRVRNGLQAAAAVSARRLLILSRPDEPPLRSVKPLAAFKRRAHASRVTADGHAMMVEQPVVRLPQQRMLAFMFSADAPAMN